jgi:hypothetical protein
MQSNIRGEVGDPTDTWVKAWSTKATRGGIGSTGSAGGPLRLRVLEHRVNLFRCGLCVR